MTSLFTKLISETSSGKKVDYTPDEWVELATMGLPLIRFFSLFPDTIFFANEANRTHMNGHTARLFFLSAVPKRYRRGDWPRPDPVTDSRTKALAGFLKVSYERARALLPVMPSYIVDTVLIQKENDNKD